MRHCYATSILSLFCLAADLPPRVRSRTFEGQRIVNVGFDPQEQPLEARAERDPAGKAGQDYSAADIRAAIERLYATGRYQDIQVDASPADGRRGGPLHHEKQLVHRQGGGEGDFGEPPNAGQIVNASRLQLGDPFDMAQIPAAVENIRKLLVQNGYFDPVIDPQLEYDSTYQQVHMTFAIKTGKRARYLPPEVSGDTSVLSAEAITKATHWHRFLLPGYRGITLSRTRSGIDKIRLKYENSNRLLATVVLDGIDEDKDGEQGHAEDHRRPGPDRRRSQRRERRFRRGKLRENVPVFEEHTVDADLLAEGADESSRLFPGAGLFRRGGRIQGAARSRTERRKSAMRSSAGTGTGSFIWTSAATNISTTRRSGSGCS